MSDTPTLFALHQAAKEGNAPLLKKANKRDINRGDQDGWTAMHWAAWNGNREALNILISRGGEVDTVDIHGSTPLHIAATYGHEGALELLITKNANLFALDNNGRTAAKVAAFFQKAECCRFLDTLSVRWEMENQDYVHKLQKKAMKDLQKRTRKISNSDSSNGTRTPNSYDYATAPSGLPNNLKKNTRPSSGGPTSRRGPVSERDAIRQNFELRHTNSSDNVGKPDSDDNLGVSKSATELGFFPSSASSTFRPVRRLNQGPLINALSELPLRIEPDDATGDSISPTVLSRSSDNLHHGHRRGDGLQQMQQVASQATSHQNDSPLATFLHSLDLVEYTEQLHKERLDLEALGMCSEDDLTNIGIPLGPRKKILHAVQRRKKIISNPSKKMIESEF